MLNAALLLLAPAPAVVWDQFCRRSVGSAPLTYSASPFSLLAVPSCQAWQKHPVAAVNSMLFWNLCLVFWALSLLQTSTWVSTIAAAAHRRPTITTQTLKSLSLQLIDPYWTLVPSLIEAYYFTHPAATGSSRSTCAAAVIALWSLRLSHSYLRR